MSVATKEPVAKQRVFNVPNQLTVSRLLLSLVLFVLIALRVLPGQLWSCLPWPPAPTGSMAIGPASTAR